MGLETGTRIADLVPTNPVGATDFVSQGDDHIRLIKAAVQGSFPSLGATAVGCTAEELNILDGATLSTAELNILDGVTLTAAQINDAARKGAANAFTQTNSFGNVTTFGDSLVPDSNGARSVGLTGTRFGDVWTVNLNGVAVSGYARVAATNSWTANQIMNAAGFAYWEFNGNGTGASSGMYVGEDGTAGGYVWNRKNLPMYFGTNNLERVRFPAAGGVIVATPTSGNALTINCISSTYAYNATDGTINSGLYIGGGAVQFGSISNHPLYFFVNNGSPTMTVTVSGVEVTGTLKAALVNSTSTTLVKHQIHHITGNATLPALEAGEWVCIVNNSGSAITITEHSGDTTYWTAAAVSVSTLTVPARGRILASGAGSSVVYVSGDISGYT